MIIKFSSWVSFKKLEVTRICWAEEKWPTQMFHQGQWEDDAGSDDDDEVISIHEPVARGRTQDTTHILTVSTYKWFGLNRILFRLYAATKAETMKLFLKHTSCVALIQKQWLDDSFVMWLIFTNANITFKKLYGQMHFIPLEF